MKTLALPLALLCLWPLAAVAQSGGGEEGPSETRHFVGRYVDGWEVKTFTENGHEDQRYWVAMTPEARAVISATLPPVFEPAEGVALLVEFDGRVSPPGRYGHLGAFDRTILMEHVTSARLEGRPAYYCDASAEADWRGGPNQIFHVTATTSGPNCRQSVATMIVRNADGDVVWTVARQTSGVMGLNVPETRTPMSDALREWIGLPGRGQTTADLPPWTHDAIPPGQSGFEFSPEPWIDRAYYSRLRDNPEPLFCFIIGLETLDCLVVRHGRLEEIGTWAFPG